MKTIAYITDIHLDEDFPTSLGIDTNRNWSHILEYISQKDIEHIVFGGDIGDTSAHTRFFESLNSFQLDVVLGNHDQQEFKSFRKAQQDGHYYHYDDNNYRYIILDSSVEYVTSQQLSWFGEVIQTQKKIIIFVHHPILAVPCYVEQHYALKGREDLRELLLESGQETTIFCGHYHLEDERTEQNIRQMVSPALSYQMVKSEEKAIDATKFGARLIHISPEQIETEVITFNND
jgi:3',5'-cyclic AMP phosphodiesterase CpdA